jgi:hypothetical protein
MSLKVGKFESGKVKCFTNENRKVLGYYCMAEG